jgi:hypothetical protein
MKEKKKVFSSWSGGKDSSLEQVYVEGIWFLDIKAGELE